MSEIPFLHVGRQASRERGAIPVVSQLGTGVKNACWAACALMLARACGVAQNETVARLSREIDVKQNGEPASTLAALLRRFGLTPVVGAEVSYPYIQICLYSILPDKNKDPRWRNTPCLHWIVRIDDMHYHDPLRVATEGANLITAKSVLALAETATGIDKGKLWRVSAKELQNA